MFRNTWKTSVVMAILATSVFILLSLLTPESDVKSKIDRSPDLFQVVDHAALVFGSDFNGAAKEYRHQIALPFSRLDQLRGYEPEHVWMEFLVHRNARDEGKFLFMPRTWGKVEIFRNGVKVIDGQNLYPEIELVSGENVIRIHSDLRNSVRNSPLTALYAPFIAAYGDGYKIRAAVWSQSSVKERTTVLFLFALLIFSVIYLADARKSELIFLILYLVVHLGRNQLAILAENNLKLTNSSFLQVMETFGPDYILGNVLLAFLAAFVRLSNNRIRKILFLSVAASPLSVGAFYLLIRPFFSEGNRTELIFICVTLHFIACHVLFLGRDVALLVKSRNVPGHRRLAVAMVFGVAITVYFLNLLDFFQLTNAITTEYRNGLFLALVICGTAGFEFAADTGMALAGRVASQAAHDIRGPLTALKSLIGTDVASTPEMQKTIIKVIDRIRIIAEDLLNVERSITSVSGEFQLVSICDLVEIIEQVSEEKRAVSGGRTFISIKNSIDDDLRLFSLVPRETLSRIFSIVLDNALDATKGKLAKIEILIVHENKNDNVKLQISDNGCGMTSGKLHCLGLRGFSDKASGSRGHGLGVQYVFSRLRDFGGSVKYLSEVGRGTTVLIRLPLQKKEENDERVVVLIDDDVLVQQAWQKSARRRGIRFRAFLSVEEFKSCLDEVHKDWPIYIDANLGSVSGVDFSGTLAKAGFSKLFIATGDYSLRKLNVPWLQGVVGKDPPWI